MSKMIPLERRVYSVEQEERIAYSVERTGKDNLSAKRYPLNAKENRYSLTAKTGFTLLEVTISLLLLTIGIVGFIHLMGVGLQSSKRAGDITEASFLCQKEMANFQANRNFLVVGNGPLTGGGRYEIKDSGISGITNLYFVKIEVLDDDNNVLTSLSTYLYKPAP